MDILITTLSNPFSFFCRAENNAESVGLLNNGSSDNAQFRKRDISDFDHGQYVAVTWNEKWVRGIVTMESHFLIWLVDYGVYLQPDEKTVFVNLPADYKKYPSKVFEASIHGVVPVDKVLTDDCQIKNEVATSWNKGAIEKAQTLIASALRKYFVPIAILSTKHNDIVLGDLYLKLVDKGMVNIIDELQMWPVFIEKNPELYITNLPIHYTTRRKHRASLLKPEFPDMEIPTISLEISLREYQTMCSNASIYDPAEYDNDSGDGSTVVTKSNRDLDAKYKLSPDEMERYSRMFVTIHGQEHNVLHILINKLIDLRTCEKYKDHDLKRVGRASSRHPPSEDDE